MMRMPEKNCSDQVPWLSQVLNPSNASGHKLLEVYLEALKGHCITSDMTSEQIIAFTNNEVAKDLSNAQIQLALMENYRRFVVIRAASEDAIPFDKDGVSLLLIILQSLINVFQLEWSPLSQFSFKDDYFQP